MCHDQWQWLECCRPVSDRDPCVTHPRAVELWERILGGKHVQRPCATMAALDGENMEIGVAAPRAEEGEARERASVRAGALRSCAVVRAEVVRGVEEAELRAGLSVEDREVIGGAGCIMRWGRPRVWKEGPSEDRRVRTLRVPCGSEVCLHRGRGRLQGSFS